MTSFISAVKFFIFVVFLYLPFLVNGLGGSATTIAVSYGSTTTICGIISDQPSQTIQCWRNNTITNIFSNVSFNSIAGGRDLICGVRSGGYSLICWNPNFIPKRLYYNETILLQDLTVGDVQICALSNGTRNANCWRDDNVLAQLPDLSVRFRSISSGLGFTCGIGLNLNNSDQVLCWGSNVIASSIQGQFRNELMLNVYVGGSHACGVNITGFLICRGDNSSGQLNVPVHDAFDFSSVALGANHSCGLRVLNNSVICWGGGVEFSNSFIEGISFESITAGLDFSCGLTSSNFSVICWGPGWFNNLNSLGSVLSLPRILPGPCVRTACQCGIYPQSETLCSGNGLICRPCGLFNSTPPVFPLFPPPPPDGGSSRSSQSRSLSRGLLAFAIIGSVGAFSGICTIIYCLWTGVCCGKKKIHNSVQPTITGSNHHNDPPRSNSGPISRSYTIRRQASRAFRRQRSGTSSIHADREEEFTFADLALATNNFSLENKIGAGSFGVVYRGKLLDGREVAIKRGETSLRTKKFQEKESAFDSELAFLSRLHHKHLVRLVGYCEERDERLLVYEYMKNGALYDHLHDKNNVEKSSSLLNSWKMRIKISLDAARGIEYLHNYAVPPIIHRDIKSSNILLDSNWVARVSDFGLSLLGPEADREYRPTKAAGTVGYIDPEYYGLNVLTAKSDVYGLGVVLLEVLTGKRAIFKSGESGGTPISIVDFAVPQIMAGELGKILDKRVGPPEMNEAEAVELVAYTAMHCVNTEGRDRPTMADIVANLERALALCDDSHGSISSGPISIVSE